MGGGSAAWRCGRHCALCRIPSADFRPWLRYHLHLPIADAPNPAVRYGDAAIDACAHGHRHTLVLTAWHHAAITAYGAAVTHREPPDYAEFSPGYRPDLAVEGGGRGGDLLLLDTKVGSPYVTSLTVEERGRAAHVAFAGTAERHVTAVLGRAQRGEPGDGPHDFATGAGYVSVKKADYDGALQRAVEVRPLIHETYGGFYLPHVVPYPAGDGGGVRRTAGRLGRRPACAHVPQLPPPAHLVCAGQGARLRAPPRHAGPPRAWRRRRLRVSARRLLRTPRARCCLSRARLVL